jgi:hypothetical protein
MKFLRAIKEALTPEINTRMEKFKDEVTNSSIISPYIIHVMAYTYKRGYATNVMLNSTYRKLDNKQSVKSEIEKIAQKYNGRASQEVGAVIKVFFKENPNEVQASTK